MAKIKIKQIGSPIRRPDFGSTGNVQRLLDSVSSA